MDIFECKDYKDYIKSYIKKLPKRGHGALRKMALHLDVHPVAITQVFNGDRDLTLEQAAGLTQFLSLSALEAEYFISLVEYSRAGNQALRSIVKSRLERMKEHSQQLENRVPKNIELTEEAKAVFYSAWYYSAARLASGIDKIYSIDDIAQLIDVDRVKVAQAIDFLIRHDLCQMKDGKIVEGPQFTHLKADSPFVIKHHTNWRLKALNAMERSKLNNELFYTLPMSLSKELATSIRSKLIKVIEEVLGEVKESKSETLYCLNMDWFRFQK